MKLSLPVRWTQRSSDPDAIQKAEIERLLNPDAETTGSAAIEYTISNIVLDTKDICAFYEFDDDITVVKTYEADMYLVVIPFEAFQKLWMHQTGENILEVKTTEKDDIIENFDSDEII